MGCTGSTSRTNIQKRNDNEEPLAASKEISKGRTKTAFIVHSIENRKENSAPNLQDISPGLKMSRKLRNMAGGPSADASMVEQDDKEEPLAASEGIRKCRPMTASIVYSIEETTENSTPNHQDISPDLKMPFEERINDQPLTASKDSKVQLLTDSIFDFNEEANENLAADLQDISPDLRMPRPNHQKALNRCRNSLLMNLNFERVCDHMISNELLDGVTERDISGQVTSNGKIRKLIDHLRQQPYSVYERFKECLNMSNQQHLRQELEKAEANDSMDDINLDENYKDIIKLQNKLIAAYRRLRSIQVSPLFDMKCDIQNVYVDLVIQKKVYITKEEEKTGENMNRSRSKMMKDVTSFKEIFFGKGVRDRLNRIYLCGKGGFGKTTFCKNVLHTWCNVKQNKEDNKTSLLKDSNVLHMFDILFYINLRDISKEETLLEVIIAQCSLKSGSDKHLISLVLDQYADKVLFILDGLDELPRKAEFVNDVVKCKSYTDCFFFISSNPSQIHQMHLNEGPEIDLILDLQGFSYENVIKCAKKILETCYNDVQAIDQFVNEIKGNRLIKDLIHVPIFLLILVQTWYENKRSLPKKFHEIYISLLDLLAERFQKKNMATWKFNVLQDDHIFPLPGKLSNMSVVTMFGEGFLAALSNVAHHFLLINNNENTLVFEEKELLKILGHDGQKKRDLALKLGLISVSHVASYIKRKTELYFLHQTMQEFFTAVYFIFNPDKLEIFVSSLRNLDDVLQRENMIVFLVGLSSQLGNQVLEKVCKLCDSDSEIIGYRCEWFVPSQRGANIMELYKRCMEEGKGPDVCLNVSDLSHTEFDVHSLQPELCKSVDLRIEMSSSNVSLDLRALTELRRVSLRYFSDTEVRLPTSGALISPILKVALYAPFMEVLYINGPFYSVLDRMEIETCIPHHQYLFDLSDMTLEHCTRLETLILKNADLQNFHLDLTNITKLSELKLCRVTMSTSSCDLLGMTLEQCTQMNLLQVEETDLHNCMLNLSKMALLSKLILREVKLSINCCDVLGGTLTHCTELRTLRLENMDLHECQLDLANMRKISNLKLLNLTVSNMCKKNIDSSLKELQSLNIFRKINSHVSYCKKENRWMVHISQVYTPVKLISAGISNSDRNLHETLYDFRHVFSHICTIDNK